MKKRFALSLALILLVIAVSTPAAAKEWYEGGTLHSAAIREWKKATYQNKLATCGDFLAALFMNGKFKAISVTDVNDLKPYAEALVIFLNTATEGTNVLDKESVRYIAALGVVKMGWDKSDTKTTSEPIISTNPAEEADKKLKANGFFLDEEIEAVWEEEKTPDVLEKLSQSQQEAQEEAAKSSLKFGASIKNASERSMYQEGVRKNKVLKATRAIAKKYGIKARDVFTVEFHLTSRK